MQKKALALSLLGVSAASVAGVVSTARPERIAAVLPAAMQGPVAYPARPDYTPSQAAYSPVPAQVSSAIARWNSLRQSDSFPFSSYASFLLSNRGWPGETAMRRTAEKAIDPGSSSASEVVGYFRAFPPLSNTGQARYAFALQATGRSGEAAEAARKAWTDGLLPIEDESRMLSLFGGRFGPTDHDARMEALLGSRDSQSAARMLPLVSPARRTLFETRLALQTRASDAASRLSTLGYVEGDPGLLVDRANWLRATGRSAEARQLLAQPLRLATRPANAEKWLDTLLTFARGAANDGQSSLAYQIAAKIEETYAPGTDVSGRSYAERDSYTDLAWLAGTSANRLARHADAARMFGLYGRAARSSQTRAKGFYWAAKAAFSAGQTAQSTSLLDQAAASPDQFYGQLALERLGRRVTPPAPTPVTISPSERSAFQSRPLVEAARALGQMGRWSDQSLFVRAIAEQAENERDRVLAAELGRSIGRMDLGVWVAREARNKGATFYDPAGFPEITVPAAYSHHWALAHGITRQESSFDRAATSPVGARGLMQLMPSTARETSGKMGLPYDLSRLTSDPTYNIQLGTGYFSTLLDQWGGNAVLAVASYNAGAGNVRKWVRENGDPRMGGDIVAWIEKIPFSETRNYVQRVLENAVVYDAMRARRTGATPTRISSYLGRGSAG
jgi:soluble lytic murein transglycosylase